MASKVTTKKVSRVSSAKKTVKKASQAKKEVVAPPKFSALKTQTEVFGVAGGSSEAPPVVEPQIKYTPAPPAPPKLVIDERIIPDSNLPTEFVEGILDIANEGSGLLRPGFSASDRDVYISASQIRRFNLRVGDKIGGQARRPKENERFWGLLKVETINNDAVEALGERPDFDNLIAIYPDAQIKLATEKDQMTTRMIDLIAPIGFGQRGLIVSPPKAGKTWLIKDIISGIAKNYPENGKGLGGNGKSGVHLMAVLIGERPEEVTDIVRHVKEVTDGHGEVASRNFDQAGSLTIIGTCLVDTGSRMDDLIYEEFKGTGNMELHLVRKLAERRVYPAIDVSRSGTRQEELLYGKDAMPQIVTLRRMLDMVSDDERTEMLLERLRKTETNEEFITSLKTV